MRRVTLWFVSTVSAVVLLFSYRTSTEGPGGVTTAAAAAVTQSAQPTQSGGATDSTRSDSAQGSTRTTSTTSFTGDAVDTRWGPVQVKITVQAKKITNVEAVVYPSENQRDQEINSYALPLLHDAVISAQSARVDTISGATVTSDGYLTSLQSALDAADLG